MKSTRRWFRFSLATLFVLVALVAAFLGSVTREVHQRKELLKWVLDNYGEVDRTDGPPVLVVVQVGDKKVFTDDLQLRGKKEHTIPRWRTWFGDEAVARITLPPGATQTDAEQAAALFPEAYVDLLPEPTTLGFGSRGFGTR
jgi:hypothetical protein